MKVLVPLDGSELSEGMLVPATRLANGEELLLVRVLGPGGLARKDQAQAAEAYLEEQRAMLETGGGPVRWCLEEGDAADRVLVVAAEQAVDLIAMATHGWTGEVRRVRGSVAERVLRSSRAPLFLCTPRGLWTAQTKAFERLLVALDGSPAADAILPQVERFALTFGASATLLHVAAGEEIDRAAATALLESRRAGLEQAGIEAHVLAGAGEPAEEILRASAEFDVVCLATHGRTGLARWWFGSVAEQVLRLCERPLLLVRSA